MSPERKKRGRSLSPAGRPDRTTTTTTRSRSRSLDPDTTSRPLPTAITANPMIPAFATKREIADQASPSARPPDTASLQTVAKGVFDDDIGLGEEDRKKFLDEVRTRLKKPGLSTEAVRTLAQRAEFLADTADTPSDAFDRWARSFRTVSRADRGKALRTQWTKQPGLLSSAILERLSEEGITPDSILDPVVRPFLDEKNHFPGTMAEDLQGILDGIFKVATGPLDWLISDTLLGDMFEADTPYEQSRACLDVVAKVRMLVVDRLDLAEGNYHDATVREIPHNVNFFWSGRAISKNALDNVIAWATAAAGTDWTVTMWSDLKISDWDAGNARAKLKRAGVAFKDARPEIDSRLDSAYALAAEHNLAACSDLFRWSLFKKTGGVYVDVDIAPGDIDFRTLSHKASQLSLPLYAPGLRDLGTVREVLGMARNAPVTTEHIRQAIDAQISLGVINSNFIALQTGSMYVDPMINKITEKTKSMDADAWRTAGGQVAGVSGPTLLMGVTADINAIKEKVTSEQGQALLGGQHVSRWPLVWLTAESENQDWSRGQSSANRK
ncbi:hypothetical protein [Lentzea sp. NPDC059081]|uniref:hypothetical protein n=1 Tax=Lentzea sp. NPDC059081 TaxID=3346719 RepID=UPI003683615B